MNYHSSLRQQRGSGTGSFFSGIFRGLMPVARSAVMKTVLLLLGLYWQHALMPF